jgi:hypothetical protein
MRTLRLAAIAMKSRLLGYGYAGSLAPVLLLHVRLLPGEHLPTAVARFG